MNETEVSEIQEIELTQFDSVHGDKKKKVSLAYLQGLVDKGTVLVVDQKTGKPIKRVARWLKGYKDTGETPKAVETPAIAGG